MNTKINKKRIIIQTYYTVIMWLLKWIVNYIKKNDSDN